MAIVKLTKTVIQNAKPSAKTYELRDTEVKGFICKISPTGNKTFYLTYRTLSHQRRKPKIGECSIYSVQEARDIARRWLQEVREGGDPSQRRSDHQDALTLAYLCDRFMRDHSELYNKPSTQKGYRQQIAQRIKPNLGNLLITEVSRADIIKLVRDNAYAPTQANRTLALLKKMFNCAELWGLREEGTNPCRLVKMYRTQPKTRLLADAEVKAIFDALDRAEYERLMAPVYILACRLQFAFAARINEILSLEWRWVDFERKLIRWPDSKTGYMEKYMDEETFLLLQEAPSRRRSAYVCPAVTDFERPLSVYTYVSSGWRRILKIAGVQHCGTHHVRHRAATDIANAVDNVRTGMQMTGHKTVQMYMRYIHPEEQRIRAAQAKMGRARRKLLNGGVESSVTD
jgi:integrase